MTYYTVPRINNYLKLFILLAFNKSKNKNDLCCIAFIQNENKETFMTIYKYIIDNYGLKIPLLACNCNATHIIAIYKIFPSTNIILCYFHVLRRLIIHMPDIRSKNKNKKIKAN